MGNVLMNSEHRLKTERCTLSYPSVIKPDSAFSQYVWKVGVSRNPEKLIVTLTHWMLYLSNGLVLCFASLFCQFQEFGPTHCQFQGLGQVHFTDLDHSIVNFRYWNKSIFNFTGFDHSIVCVRDWDKYVDRVLPFVISRDWNYPIVTFKDLDN